MFQALLDTLAFVALPSQASMMALRGTARDEALHDAVEHYIPLRDSYAGRVSGLKDLKLEGISDPIISLNDPYPKYGHHRPDLSDINQLDNDREMIRNLKDGKTADVIKPALVWLQGFSKRARIKSRMENGDDTKLAMALQRASYSDREDAKEIFAKECESILRRLMPEALTDADRALKKAVAKHLFTGIRDEAGVEDHIALSSVSSMEATGNTILRSIKRGDHVILPVPYFDPFPVILDQRGANIITTDTTRTGYKLRAEDLRKLVEEKHLKKGSWLLLTSPNNATMTRYTKEEMQAIANVVAEKELNVICDELYARLSSEPHVSLASLEAYGPDGPVHMRDRVITVSGCSKQFPFGSDMKRKLGAALLPDNRTAKLIEEDIKMGSGAIRNQMADIYRTLIETTPGRMRTECYSNNDKDQEKVTKTIEELNSKYGSMNLPKPFEIFSSPGGYLACLKLNDKWAEKSGIRTSEDLTDYLFATTGLFTKSMLTEGVVEPVVRFNINQCAEYITETQNRLDSMLKAITEQKAPPMSHVRRAINELVKQAPQISSDQIRYATR